MLLATNSSISTKTPSGRTATAALSNTAIATSSLDLNKIPLGVPSTLGTIILILVVAVIALELLGARSNSKKLHR